MNAAADTTLADLRAGRLAGATRLDLRGAGLDAFPDAIFDLADTLETLDLSRNALHRLPDDLGRLSKLRTLFCSDNRFTTLPEALGGCAQLDIVGFKANAIADVPEASLSPSLRWLILTDNRITALPTSLVRCVRLQKLMLAGNRLTAWPTGLEAFGRLELLRLSANRFATIDAALPESLLALPRLAWLAVGGNPYNAAAEARSSAARPIAAADLRIGALLGEGASGHIRAADWRQPDGTVRPVAVKRFKGAVTSDGLPRTEMAASLAIGDHPHLVGILGRLGAGRGEPDGLVMRRIPAGHRNLAGPPSLVTCSRDVYADDTRFAAAEARTLAAGIASALAHLHARGLMHGDLYAHNVLHDATGHALLGDFGAASFLPDDPRRREGLKRLDLRALGWLIDEIAERCDDPRALDDLRPSD